MSYTFGLMSTDYVEVEDPDQPGQAIRPDAGTTLIVHDAFTGDDVTGLVDDGGSPVTSVVTTNLGYFQFGCDSPLVLVSADGGTVFKAVVGLEALSQGITAGTAAAQALQVAQNAQSNIGSLIASEPIFKFLDSTGKYVAAQATVYVGSAATPPEDAGESVSPTDIWLQSP